MHEFMEFYRMDYTNNIFVHESNYKGNTNREMISNFCVTIEKKLKLEKTQEEKPILATLVELLMSGKIQSENGDAAKAEESEVKINPIKLDESEQEQKKGNVFSFYKLGSWEIGDWREPRRKKRTKR